MESGDDFALAGNVLEGRFRVDRFVAKGGFGVVYEGLHLALQKPIAIKVLRVPDELTDKSRALIYQQFQLEARTIGRLAHPNIVQAIDLGVSLMNGALMPWMVLEWLPGTTLREWLHARPSARMSPSEALALLQPVFKALACAHDENVAHRDVKPSNIMVTELRRGERMIRLMDFGIAKLMEDGEAAGRGSTRTSSDTPTYTPLYGAPEQATGSRTGPWTDVHALGLLLTEALVGRPAYPSHNARTLVGDILSLTRPTPAIHGVNVGPWEAVLARALHSVPAERYPNAAEMLAALENTMPGVSAPQATSSVPATRLSSAVPEISSSVPYRPAPEEVNTPAMRPIGPATRTHDRPRRPARGLAMAAGGLALLAAGSLGTWLALRGSPAMPVAATPPAATNPAPINPSPVVPPPVPIVIAPSPTLSPSVTAAPPPTPSVLPNSIAATAAAPDPQPRSSRRHSERDRATPTPQAPPAATPPPSTPAEPQGIRID